MKGLIKKDLFTLMAYKKSILILIVFMLVFAFVSKDVSFVPGFIGMLFVVIPLASFSYDNYSGFNDFALALPISKRDIVKSKYIVALLFGLAGILLSIVISLAAGLLQEKLPNLAETFVTAYVMAGVLVLFISILFPLIFQFGIEKGRFFIMFLALVPFLLITLSGQNLSAESLTQYAGLIEKLLYVIPPASIVVFVLSYFVSRTIFERKEV